MGEFAIKPQMSEATLFIGELGSRRPGMTALKPYPAYKDSSAEWLGRIPTHWDVAALRYRYQQSLGKMLDTKQITGEHLVPYLRNVDVQWDSINVRDLPHMDIRPHEIDRFTVRPGDLLVCEGGETGRCAIWHGKINPCGYQKALHRLRPLDRARDNPRFLCYTFAVAVTRGAFADGQGSTIGHLTGEMLRAHRFPFPQPSEQRAIADFLDRETARIDALFARRERIVELLEEQKQVVIEKAVKGQIDVRTGRPYPAYRDSGVEWLGNVPAHWSVCRNRWLFRERNETGFGALSILEVSLRDGVRVRDMRGGQRKQQIMDRDRYKRAKKDDIAYNTMRMWQGAVGVVPEDGLVSPAYVVMAPVERVESRYYEFLFRTEIYKHAVKTFSRGIVSDRDRLYWDEFKRIASFVPPLEEQSAIVRFLDHVGRRIEDQIGTTKRQIDLLRECRERLVADVVTGKLDVREAAARLPKVDSIAGGGRVDATQPESKAHARGYERNNRA